MLKKIACNYELEKSSCKMAVEIDAQPSEYSDVSLRPLHCRLNAHTRSDGSAMLTQGDTAVTASVCGPIEVKLHNLQIDKAHVEVYYRSKSGLPSIADKLREKIVRDTCEAALLTILYPRSSIFLQIHEMENAGGLIACAVNASCLALLNSGLSMKSLLAGVHCAITNDNELVLDPDQLVCEHAVASLTFVFECVQRNVVAAHTTGRFTIGQYNDAVIKCRHASDIIFKFYREAIRKFATHATAAPTMTNVET